MNLMKGNMVRTGRLELPQFYPLEPKSSASTNFATSAYSGVIDGARTHDSRNHNPGLYQLSYNHHYNRLFLIYGASGRIRTCYPRLRRPMLYPNELQTHLKWSEQRDLNPRPSGPKPDALPSCAMLRQWWPETESNRRHEDFQSSALPTELSGQ